MDDPPILLSRLHFPVTTSGLGQRIGIWFQGCSLKCNGCISVDTWAANRGHTTVGRIMEASSEWLPKCDGITISGGEPFQQPEALAELLRQLRSAAGSGKDILVYSGFRWEDIQLQANELAGLVDVIISEPFIKEAGQTLIWRGSDNQRMHLLTPLGHERYEPWVNAPLSALPKAVDIFFEDGVVWMAGIPRLGTIDQIQDSLAKQGIEAKGSQLFTKRENK